MVPLKRNERTTAFSQAVNTLGNAIQAARQAKAQKLSENKQTETEQPAPAKSLADLLRAAAAEV